MPLWKLGKGSVFGWKNKEKAWRERLAGAGLASWPVPFCKSQRPSSFRLKQPRAYCSDECDTDWISDPICSLGQRSFCIAHVAQLFTKALSLRIVFQNLYLPVWCSESDCVSQASKWGWRMLRELGGRTSHSCTSHPRTRLYRCLRELTQMARAPSIPVWETFTCSYPHVLEFSPYPEF